MSDILSEGLFRRFRSEFEPHIGDLDITPEVFQRADVEVPLEKYAELLERVARSTNPDIGLAMGEHLRAAELGVIGHAMAASTNVAEMLNVLSRYIFVFSHKNTARLDMAQEHGVFTYTFPLAHPDLVRQDAEYAIACVTSLIRRHTGKAFRPDLVEFAHQQPASVKNHLRLFDCEVQFGRQFNRLHLRKTALSFPLTTADSSLLAALRFYMNDRLKIREEEAELLDRVRHLVVTSLHAGSPDIEDIAKQLGTSKRTLQRKLKDRNVLYSDLVDSERANVAVSYVDHSSYSLTDIAFMLGYSELSAFSRAFRRWTGCSPQSVRSAQAVEPGNES